MDGCGLLTGDGGDVVVVIIWCCRVGSIVGVFILSAVGRGRIQLGPLASLLLFVGGGQSGFHASIRAGGLLLTFVARYGMTPCLRPTARFVCLQGVVGCPDQGALHDPLGS